MTPARKRINARANTPIMYAVARDLGLDVKTLNANSYRLTKSIYAPIDYFPASNKVCVVGSNKYDVVEDIRAFLTERFSSAPTSKKPEKRCTDCLHFTAQDELDKYNGKCEFCFTNPIN